MKKLSEEGSESPKAAALVYDQQGAPRIVAKGRGEIARKIIEEAKGYGIPLQKNENLVEALLHVELTKEIPPELYRTVAEILAFVYRLNKAAAEKPGRNSMEMK